jgi:uracil-DNA glycosylase
VAFANARLFAKQLVEMQLPNAAYDYEIIDLSQLREEAASCRRCPLWRNATQTVFGEGPVPAKMMFVGEQPGDKEDLAGRPFVGPAGLILDQALEEAGIDRTKVYVTNAVKHFKNEPRGKRRLHKKPDTSEIEACRWWLAKEINLVRPRLTVALGATAAGALMRRPVTIGRLRGEAVESESGSLWITVHPSYLLRLPDETSRQREFLRFVKDLQGAKSWLASHSKRAI